MNRASGMEAISDVFLGGETVTARPFSVMTWFFEHPRDAKLSPAAISCPFTGPMCQADPRAHDLRRGRSALVDRSGVQCIVGGAPRRPMAEGICLHISIVAEVRQRVQVFSEAPVVGPRSDHCRRRRDRRRCPKRRDVVERSHAKPPVSAPSPTPMRHDAFPMSVFLA